jgi:glycosyltransferase involved in cell wall biosynthesis
MKLISIIIPIRDEAETIGYLLDEIKQQISKVPDYLFEIIVVLDHCRDNSEAIVKEKQVYICYNNKKPGKGYAVITGLLKSKGDIVIILDGDCSHDPRYIPDFIEAVSKGAYLVIGSRAKGGSDEYEIIRLLGNAIFTFLLDLFFSLSLTDGLNGYRALRRELLNNYQYRSRGFEIEIEFIYSALINGYSIREIPCHERERMGGRMKSRTFIDGFKFFIAILKWGLKFRLLKLLKSCFLL